MNALNIATIRKKELAKNLAYLFTYMNMRPPKRNGEHQYNIRNGEYEALPEKAKDPYWKPGSVIAAFLMPKVELLPLEPENFSLPTI